MDSGKDFDLTSDQPKILAVIHSLSPPPMLDISKEWG